ncbi:MAG: hypothetical protein ACRBFS_22780 [Aureispira sp.]
MKNLITISVVSFFTLFGSCQIKEESAVVQKKGFTFPIIIDTTKFKVSRREATWRSTANYELLYIGQWKDTIQPNYKLKYNLSFTPPLPTPLDNNFSKSDTFDLHNERTDNQTSSYYIDWLAPNNYKSWQKANLLITVDTTQRVKNDDTHVNIKEPFFDAYPVLIENKDLDTITIAYGNFVPLITEAKDSTGNWRPIEERWIYGCGNGVGSVILPPQEIALSATMIYHGIYKTTLRLRIDSVFSNEFNGQINYRQFKSRFNE